MERGTRSDLQFGTVWRMDLRGQFKVRETSDLEERSKTRYGRGLVSGLVGVGTVNIAPAASVFLRRHQVHCLALIRWEALKKW